MSNRLQVLLEEAEYRDLREAARRKGMTVAAWVREAIRAARAVEPVRDARRKLEAVRRAVTHSFPTAEIDRMLEEIERGYAG